MTSRFPLLLFFLCVWCFSCVSCQENDVTKSLLDFYDELGGDDWTLNSGWVNRTGDFCDWYGIQCDNGTLKQISLVANNLVGSLSNLNFKHLGSLEYLELARNSITGEIPASIVELSSLVSLDFQFNDITGGLPDVLGLLTNLQSINFYKNNIHWICANITQCENLTYINLGHNALCGSFPTFLIDDFEDLELRADGNPFWCPIPERANATGATCVTSTITHATPSSGARRGQNNVFVKATDLEQFANCRGGYVHFYCAFGEVQVNGLFYEEERYVQCRAPPVTFVNESTSEDLQLRLFANSTEITNAVNYHYYVQPNVTALDPTQCASSAVGSVTVIGDNFFQPENPSDMRIRYGKEHPDGTRSCSFLSSTVIQCELPASDAFTGNTDIYITMNGVDYYNDGLSFLFLDDDSVTWIASFGVATAVIIVIVIVFVYPIYQQRKSKKPYKQLPNMLDYGSNDGDGGFESEWGIDRDDLHLVACLHRGNTSSVWQGQWHMTTVAVKKISTMSVSEIGHFKEECRLISKLRHPNVVQFFGVCKEDNNTMCMVTEYMTRGSLYDVLRDHSIEWDWALLMSLALGCARGMFYLHNLTPPIIHRDVKSSNFLVNDKFEVKVADFGLSRLQDLENSTMTFCGTPKWTAPEVLGLNRYSGKADVYSFGIVLWELFTQQEPYHGMPAMQVVVRVVSEGLRPTIPSTCPKPLSQLMEACWSADPNFRPNFKEIVQTLESM